MRNRLAAGDVDHKGFMELATVSSSSIGRCNTMGMVLSMNSLTKALGMSSPGYVSIPAAYRECEQIVYTAGRCIVDLVHEDVCPSMAMTRLAFENAIMVTSVLSASTSYPPHLITTTRHMSAELSLEDWQRHGESAPLLMNRMPVGEYPGENLHHSGDMSAVLHQLNTGGLLRHDCPTVSGRMIDVIADVVPTIDREVTFPMDVPPEHHAGFIMLSGNLSDNVIMKMPVVGEIFRQIYLSEPGTENVFETRVIVFDDPEGYHARISNPALAIDERCILVIRSCGTVDYLDNTEVVSMVPPVALVK